MIPRLTEVFVIGEASMHAWKNLGYGPEEKSFFERTFGSEYAYEMGIGFLGMLEKERLTASEIQATLLQHNMGDETPPEHLLKALKRSPALRKALKANAHLFKQVNSRDPEQASEMLNQFVMQFPPEKPAGYDDPEKEIMTTRSGRKWIVVDDEDCKSYEGGMMQHCGVSTSNMVSLRDPSGKPVVTADVEYGTGIIHQLRGKQNTVPDKKYWPDCEDLVQDMYTMKHAPVTFNDFIYAEDKGGDEFVNMLLKRKLIEDPWDEWKSMGPAPQDMEDPEEHERMHQQLRQNLYPDREQEA